MPHTSRGLSNSEFSSYVQWTRNIWDTGRKGDPLRDIAVAGLGLTGETGEILDAVESLRAGRKPASELLKELGDAVYYCALLSEVFQVSLDMPTFQAGALQLEKALAEHLAPGRSVEGFDRMFALAPELLKSLGSVSEMLKKYVRNGVEASALDAFKVRYKRASEDYLLCWMALVVCTPWTPQQILQTNRAKLEERYGVPVLE